MRNKIKKIVFSVCLAYATTALYAPSDSEIDALDRFFKNVPAQIEVESADDAFIFLGDPKTFKPENFQPQRGEPLTAALGIERLQNLGKESAQNVLKINRLLKHSVPLNDDGFLNRFYMHDIDDRKAMHSTLEALRAYRTGRKLNLVEKNLAEGALSVIEAELGGAFDTIVGMAKMALKDDTKQEEVPSAQPTSSAPFDLEEAKRQLYADHPEWKQDW